MFYERFPWIKIWAKEFFLLEWVLKVGHCIFFISSSFCAVWLVSWLGKRSLFMVTDDQSPMQSIRLVLIFSQRREKKGWLLLCFCVAGTGLCQPHLQWPHLPLGPWLRRQERNWTTSVFPFSLCGNQGFWAGAMLSYHHWPWHPWSSGGCGCQAVPEMMLWALPVLLAQLQVQLSHLGVLPRAPLVAVSGKSNSIHDSKGKEGIAFSCSFSYNGFFYFQVMILWCGMLDRDECCPEIQLVSDTHLTDLLERSHFCQVALSGAMVQGERRDLRCKVTIWIRFSSVLIPCFGETTWEKETLVVKGLMGRRKRGKPPIFFHILHWHQCICLVLLQHWLLWFQQEHDLFQPGSSSSSSSFLNSTVNL